MQERDLVGKFVGVAVPESWPGSDLADVLPVLALQVAQDPGRPIWDGLVIHKADATLIGDIGFMGGPDAQGVVEVGYSIVPEYRNQGYATEIVSALARWALQQPYIHAVTASTREDNLSSIRVLTKVGMQRVGEEDGMVKWEMRREESANPELYS